LCARLLAFFFFVRKSFVCVSVCFCITQPPTRPDPPPPSHSPPPPPPPGQEGKRERGAGGAHAPALPTAAPLPPSTPPCPHPWVVLSKSEGFFPVGQQVQNDRVGGQLGGGLAVDVLCSLKGWEGWEGEGRGRVVREWWWWGGGGMGWMEWPPPTHPRTARTLTLVSAPARSSSATLGASPSWEAMSRSRSHGARLTMCVWVGWMDGEKKRVRERERVRGGASLVLRRRAARQCGASFSLSPPHPAHKTNKLTGFELVQPVVVTLRLFGGSCSCVGIEGERVRGGG
jgi:hypothetical protein